MKFVVTAGPTREPIDAVRFISNRSSGKMGFAIANAALAAGHEVTLIHGQVCIEPPKTARAIAITTSDEMNDAVCAALDDCDVLVMCAGGMEEKTDRRDAISVSLVDLLGICVYVWTHLIRHGIGKEGYAYHDEYGCRGRRYVGIEHEAQVHGCLSFHYERKAGDCI